MKIRLGYELASVVIIFALLLSSCRKRDDSALIYQPLLLAHQWVLDSSNTQTFTGGTSTGVITKIKGDSSMTLTYLQSTYDERNHQTTVTKNYQLDGPTIYYWDQGASIDYTRFRLILNVDNTSLTEQVIINGESTSSNTFNFYHAK